MAARTDFRDYTKTLYEVISSPSGERDWDRMRTLFHPDARMVRTGIDEDGRNFVTSMSVEDYVVNAETLLQGVAFYEEELEHEAEFFGNVARMTSRYASSWQKDDVRVDNRGVNYFTLVNDGESWLIMSIVWDNER